jgi:murein DD-endopeptidase MepM/ murein hydrolase activator NlpD
MRVTGVAEAQAAVARYLAAMEAAVPLGLAQGGKGRVEPWGKARHPWTNRTGAAERGLTTFVEPTGTGYALVNAHGVPYGRYLELKHDGRYAVLSPALRATWGLVLQDVAAAITQKVGAG